MIVGDADHCDDNHEEDHYSFHFHEKGGGGRQKRRGRKARFCRIADKV